MPPNNHKDLTIACAGLLGGNEYTVERTRGVQVHDEELIIIEEQFYCFAGERPRWRAPFRRSRYMAAKEFLERNGYAVRNGVLKKLPRR
jgi:hypothetical protein